MSDTELFKRAATDTAFRQAKLDDLRYFKNVGTGLVAFCVVLGAAFSLYGGLSAGKWDMGFGLFVAAFFAACTRASLVTRLAALRALDEKAV